MQQKMQAANFGQSLASEGASAFGKDQMAKAAQAVCSSGCRVV
jgi:hypothetical protein